MRNGRNFYVLSPSDDEAGLRAIEFEAWGKEDAVARANALMPRNCAFMLSRNGRPIGTVTISEDGAWTCVPEGE